jgi:hypothetical protein
MDSQIVEASFTSDYINARVPHRGETLVATRSFFVFMTSDRVETTRDFANRSSIVRIRRRQSHQFKQFAGGDLLAHVRANEPYYLGCVFSVLWEWVNCGKPRSQLVRRAIAGDTAALIFACKTGKGRFPQGYQYFASSIILRPTASRSFGIS